MRVLLDESLPHDLAAELRGHDVQTVVGAGWAGLQNGELLRRAHGQFDVFVTMDQGIPFQQNVPALKWASWFSGLLPIVWPTYASSLQPCLLPLMAYSQASCAVLALNTR